jgi:hypothetical protein
MRNICELLLVELGGKEQLDNLRIDESMILKYEQILGSEWAL